MHESWIAISAARAQAHRLYGVRGWLITLLWLNTLPVLAIVLTMAMNFATAEGTAGRPPLALGGLLLLLLGLVMAAFLRVRWFPVLWFVYCLLQLPIAGLAAFGVMWMAGPSTDIPRGLPMVVLGLGILIPVATMVYIVRSRRVRVTYWHAVRTSDQAAVPTVFDRPSRNETPTDATDHARERAALRRVTQELSSGVLDTQTWIHVMRHHAEATDSARTTAYVRARMAVLCPPAHVHPPLLRTLSCGLAALLVSLLVAALLAAGLILLAFRLPSGMPVAGLGALIPIALTLCWLVGLFAGARFLRYVG